MTGSDPVTDVFDLQLIHFRQNRLTPGSPEDKKTVGSFIYHVHL